MTTRINELVLDTELKPGGFESAGSIYPQNDRLLHRTQKLDRLVEITFLNDFNNRLTADKANEILQSVDGITYTTSLDFTDIIVYRGLLRQSMGAGNDFQITGNNQITFNSALSGVGNVIGELFIKPRYIEISNDIMTTQDGGTTYTSTYPMLNTPLISRGGIQSVGANNDYLLTNSTTVTFNQSLGSVPVTASYVTESIVIGETMTRVDARTYKTKFPFQKIKIFRGLPQVPGAGNDFTLVDDTTILFTVDIPISQSVLTDYTIKSF